MGEGTATGSAASPTSHAGHLAAGLVFVLFCMEAFHGGPHFALAATAWLVLGAMLFFSSSVSERNASISGASVGALVAVGALSFLSVSSEMRSAAFLSLLCAPLLFWALFPAALFSLLLTAAASVAASVAVVVFSGQTLAGAEPFVLFGVVSALFAVSASVSARRAQEDEAWARRQGEEAASALLRLKERHQQIEGLASAGQKAAVIAHDMANPMASLRCNLEWLRDKTFSDPLHSDQGEVSEVLRESCESLDRLATILADFRATAREARALLPGVETGKGLTFGQASSSASLLGERGKRGTAGAAGE